MMFLLFSVFGFVVADRFLSRLEKFNFISSTKRKFFFLLTALPLYFFVVFKEHLILITTYIGIFLLSLIFFYIYFEKTLKKLFEQSQILLLDGLILQMKVGSSPQKAMQASLKSISTRDKRVFEPLKHIYSNDFSEKQIQFSFSKPFIFELKHILQSSSRVIEQLHSFRHGLKIQISLRHKSRQASLQIHAQAVVAVFVYIVIFYISYANLNLSDCKNTIFISLILFFLGFLLIFKIGDHIKWRI